jgi:hypothetical protein
MLQPQISRLAVTSAVSAIPAAAASDSVIILDDDESDREAGGNQHATTQLVSTNEVAPIESVVEQDAIEFEEAPVKRSRVLRTPEAVMMRHWLQPTSAPQRGSGSKMAKFALGVHAETTKP